MLWAQVLAFRNVPLSLSGVKPFRDFMTEAMPA